MSAGGTYRARRFWTAAELDFIVATHATLTAVEQARQLGRDYDVLCWQRQRLLRAGRITRSARKWAPVYTDADRDRIVYLAQAGYSVLRIGRALGRSYGSIVHEIASMGGIKALRADPLGRVWTPSELGALFGLTKHTIDKWVRLHWIASTRNTAPRPSRRQRTDRLITDDALQQFLGKRAYWPAWHPAMIADADWAAYARDVRAAAGGDWVAMAAAAQQTGLRITHLWSWFRTGKVAGFTTLRYGWEHFIWSADLDALAARMRADPRTGRTRRPHA